MYFCGIIISPCLRQKYIYFHEKCNVALYLKLGLQYRIMIWRYPAIRYPVNIFSVPDSVYLEKPYLKDITKTVPKSKDSLAARYCSTVTKSDLVLGR